MHFKQYHQIPLTFVFKATLCWHWGIIDITTVTAPATEQIYMWRCIMVACNGLKTVEHQVAPFHSFSYLLARRKFKPKFMTNTVMTACREIVMHMRQNGSSWRT